MAQSMSKSDYSTSQDKIAAEYKSAKSACASLSGNPKDICVAEAEGREKIARAELTASYKPTGQNLYQARVAKAEADYAMAKERCDDRAGNAKNVCVSKALAVEIAAKADADAQMKTADANAGADEKSAEARSKANHQAAEARKEAAEDKRAGQYEVARQQCDMHAGSAKDVCLDRAKVRFGKQCLQGSLSLVKRLFVPLDEATPPSARGRLLFGSLTQAGLARSPPRSW